MGSMCSKEPVAKWAHGCHMPSFPNSAEMRRPRTSDVRSPCTWAPRALKRDAGIPGRYQETVPTKGRHAIMRTSRFTGAFLGLRQGIIHWPRCLSSSCTAQCTVPESWMNLRATSGPQKSCSHPLSIHVGCPTDLQAFPRTGGFCQCNNRWGKSCTT